MRNFVVKITLPLKSIIKYYHPERSLKAIKRGIDRGMCFVNGRPEKFASRVLQPGDRVRVDERRWEGFETKWDEQRILYEDGDLLVYDKLPGVVSEREALNGFYPAHRLDKETSGALLLAKNRTVLPLLENLFRKRAIDKVYLAVVAGIPKEEKGTLVSQLAPLRKWEGQTLYGSVAQGGKEAITDWVLVKKGHQSSLLEVRPRTGRTHQIRCHLAEMGYPIVGDLQYGKASGAARVLLHSQRLAFTHPNTGEALTIRAPIPLEFQVVELEKKQR